MSVVCEQGWLKPISLRMTAPVRGWVTWKSLSWTTPTSMRLALFNKSFMRLLKQQANLPVKKTGMNFSMEDIIPVTFVAKLTRDPSSCPRIKCCLIGDTLPANPLQMTQMTLMPQRSSQVLMKAVWKTKLIVILKRHTEDHDDVAESTEMKNKTERIYVPCPDPCLPCDKLSTIETIPTCTKQAVMKQEIPLF